MEWNHSHITDVWLNPNWYKYHNAKAAMIFKQLKQQQQQQQQQQKQNNNNNKQFFWKC